MKRSFLVFLFVLSIFLFSIYLYFDTPTFPDQPPSSLLSDEPGDVEDFNNRRSYFVDQEREEIISFYKKQIENWSVLGIKWPVLRLNYPPEEATKIIRDQTRSTYLEEVVHPFRESIFINGFEPKEKKDEIIVHEKRWKQKITIKFVKSPKFLRYIIFFLALYLFFYLLEKILDEVICLWKKMRLI